MTETYMPTLRPVTVQRVREAGGTRYVLRFPNGGERYLSGDQLERLADDIHDALWGRER